jgi:aspartate racemase
VTEPPSAGPVLGIVGGMGPLASSEFLRTLYRLHLAEPEQGSPRCILDSDPTFPDRTEMIREGRVDLLAERLGQTVRNLLAAGASRVVIACVTVHCALPLVPEPERRRVVSLLDLVIDELLAAGSAPFLLLATSGTRAARIFESHERWGEVADRVAFLNEQDQERLHSWVYRLKAGDPGEACRDWLASLPGRYGAAGLVFGCTELHLLRAGFEGSEGGPRILDPLWTAARDLPALLQAETSPGNTPVSDR